jgi:hypothetical protein
VTDKPEKKQDSDLFLASIGKVTPIKSDKHSVAPSQKPKPYPRKKTLQFADKLTLAQTEAVHALHGSQKCKNLTSSRFASALVKPCKSCSASKP